MKYFALHVHCIIVSVALNLETRVNYGRNKLQSFRKPTRLRFVRKSHLNQTDNIGNVQATDKATDDSSSDSWQDEREPPVLFLWKIYVNCKSLQSERDPYPLSSSNIASSKDKDDTTNDVAGEDPDRMAGKRMRRCLFPH